MSVDFEKAFDSVERVALVRVLKYYKCDPRLIEVVMGIYMGDSTETFRYGKLVGDTEVTNGISKDAQGHPSSL